MADDSIIDLCDDENEPICDVFPSSQKLAVFSSSQPGSKNVQTISLLSDDDDEDESEPKVEPVQRRDFNNRAPVSSLLQDRAHSLKQAQLYAPSISSSSQSRYSQLLDTDIFNDDDDDQDTENQNGAYRLDTVRPHFEFNDTRQSTSSKRDFRIDPKHFDLPQTDDSAMEGIEEEPISQKTTGRKRNAAGAKVNRAEQMAKKLEKQQQREQLKAEKQKEANFKKALVQANKVMADKRVVVYEIVIELDARIVELASCEGLLQELVDKSIKFEIKNHPIPYTAIWKRVVPKRWDQNAGAFVPLEREHMFDEHFVLYMPTIDEFTSEMIAKNRLEEKIRHVQSVFRQKKILVLLDGLDQYLQKRKRQTNQSFKDQLRGNFRKSGTSSEPKPSSPQKMGDMNQNLPDKAAIDLAILRLQMELDCSFVSTNKKETCTDWIVTYSREIAVGPYE